MSATNDMVVILTTGKQDRGARATLALSWACTSLAMGKSVALFLTMDATVWALQGAMDGVQVDGFEPLEAYLEQFFALDGSLLVCAPCTKYYCGFGSEGDSAKIHPAAQIAGLSTVVGRLGGQSQAITF